MTAKKFHLCPRCSRSFTPKYKVASYRGGKVLCPRCERAARPPKQAKSVLMLREWASEAGIVLYFSQDLGDALHYVCDGRWRKFDASVDKQGKIFVTYGRMQDGIAADKRHFMELVQLHRDYIGQD